MYYSSIFVFCLLVVVNLSLSGADVNRDLLNSNYKMPPNNGPQDEVVNIGNGYGRNNVVVLEENPSNSDSFQGGGSNPGQPRQYPSSTVNNIGNGYHNYNTVAVNSGGRTPQTQHRSSNTGNSGGTSFVSPSGTDHFNSGYGTDKHYQIPVNSKPLQPPAPVNSGGRTPQAQHRSFNTGNSGGTSFVSPSGTNHFNGGYGTDKNYQIPVNSKQLQPPAPVNRGGRTPQAQHRSSNTGNSGGTSFVSPSGTDLFNVGYGKDNRNQILVNSKPLQPPAPVNSGGRTPQAQHRSSNTGNSGGTSFVSPSGTDRFNVGYGKDNQNQIFINGRPLQPQAPVNSGGRTPQTQNNARNNGGQESNSNQIYVNGLPIQPVYNDGTYSTYVLKDQTIHVLNSGSRQPTNRGSQLKRLYALYAQILQIKSQLNHEAARLNIKYLMN